MYILKKLIKQINNVKCQCILCQLIVINVVGISGASVSSANMLHNTITRHVNVRNIASYGSGRGQLIMPSGLAIEGRDILVVDTGNRRIQRFSLNGQNITSFQTIRDSDGNLDRLQEPIDVDTDRRGRIYISDADTDSIFQFNSYGEFEKQIGSFGRFGVAFNGIRGLSVDPFGFLYIADSGNNRVIKVDKLGRKVFETRRDEGQLNRPNDVQINSKGQLIVLDSEGIKLYDELGRFQRFVYKNQNISAMAIHSNDRIFAADHKRRVLLYLHGGKEVIIWRSPSHIRGLAVEGNDVWVTDAAHSLFKLTFTEFQLLNDH